VDFKKEDWKFFLFTILLVLTFLLLILAPKPYWLDGGGVILR